MQVDPQKVIDNLREIIGSLTLENVILRVANGELDEQVTSLNKFIQDEFMNTSHPDEEEKSNVIDIEEAKSRHPASGNDPHPIL